MTQIQADLGAVRVRNAVDTQAFRQQLDYERENRASAYEAFGAGAAMNWLSSGIGRLLERADFSADEFNVTELTDTQRKILLEGVNPENYARLASAKNYEHARVIRDQIIRTQSYQRTLADAGGLGVIANLSTAILDPIAIGATAGVGIIGGAARGLTSAMGASSALTKTGRLGSLASRGFIRGAAGGAATEGLIEGVVVSSDPTATMDDIALSVLFASALGGGIGGVAGEVTARAIKQAEFREWTRIQQSVAGGGELTEEGRRYFSELINPRTNNLVLDEAIELLDFDDADLAIIRSARESGEFDEVARLLGFVTDDLYSSPPRRTAEGVSEQGAMGAASASAFGQFYSGLPGWLRDQADRVRDLFSGRADAAEVAEALGRTPEEAAELKKVMDELPQTPPKVATDFFPEPNTAKTKYNAVRWGVTSVYGDSDDEFVRGVGSMLVDDPVLRADGSGQGESASRFKQREFNRIYGTGFQVPYRKLYSDYAKSNKIPLTSRALGDGLNNFNERVGVAARKIANGEDVSFQFAPEVVEAAELVNKHRSDMLQLAKRHGRLLDVPDDARYLERLYDDDKLWRNIEIHGEDNVAALFAKALTAKQDLDSAKATKVAKGMLSILRNRRLAHLEKLDFLNGDRATIREMLEESQEAGGLTGTLSSEDINDIARILAPDDAQSGGVMSSRERRRVDLDDTTRYSYTDANGNTQTISFEDLLDNNAERMTAIYTDQILGVSAMEQVLSQASLSLGKPIQTTAALRREIARRSSDVARARGLDQRGVDRYVAKVLRNHDLAVDYTLGRRTSEDSALGDWARRVRLFNMMRMGGTFGVAGLAEAPRAATQGTFRGMMRATPGLRRFIKEAQEGTLNEAEAKQMLAVAGISGEMPSHNVIPGLETEFGLGGPERTKRRADTVLRRGARATGFASMQTPIQQALRSFAGRNIMYSLDEAARSGKGLNAKRLAAMGIDQESWKRIQAEMNRSVNGRRVSLNIDQWENVNDASKLVAAINKFASTAVQTNDIGVVAPWMTGNLAKTFIQFRSFMLGSWEMQALRALSIADKNELASGLFSMFVAGAAYTAQEYVRSLGRPDAEEYRRERLATDRIAAAAFQRAGIASFLPDMSDTLTGAAFDGYKLFNQRNSGLEGGLLNNPSDEIVQALFGRGFAGGSPGGSALGNVMDIVRGEGTLNDYNRLRRFVPFGNHPLFELMSNQIVGSVVDE